MRDYKKPEQNEELKAKVYAFAKDRVYEISRKGSAKHERSDAYSALKDELILSLGEEVTDFEKNWPKNITKTLSGKLYVT